MIRRILILSVGLFLAALTSSAKEEIDSAILELTRQHYRLFDTDSADAFAAVTDQLKQMHLEKGDKSHYYSLRHNEVLYEADHGQPYLAIKNANLLLEEMEGDPNAPVAIGHLALGTIFESRGNYRIAMRYYQEALDKVKANDTIWLPLVYIQIVLVNITHDTNLAWQWNERLGHSIAISPRYKKLYLNFKGQIYFFTGEKEKFFETKRELDKFSPESTGYNYGDYVISVMETAFRGKYNEALKMLEQPSQDYDEVKRSDIRIRIFEMMGQYDLAMKETDILRDLRDSLNNDITFESINEINASAGMVKLNEKTAREQELWMMTIIVLMLVAFGLLISRYFTHRRYQKKVEKQNKQLEIALAEAKESDRMKGVFIQHISHEIRTPLNIINGYTQIVANPEIELEKQERDTLLKDIDVNTTAITDIVDDLLELSQEEDANRYPRNEQVAVNELCRRLMKRAEKKNSNHLKLHFQTNLTDDMTILSNREGLWRILRQLVNNSLKFTEQGLIELTVYKSTDNKHIYFTVTDTGVGIPDQMHDQVFEHFYKLDDFKQGLGIGLPMSRKIANLLGGTLTIGRNYHDGARFVLCIPIL